MSGVGGFMCRFFLWERHLMASVASSEGWLPRSGSSKDFRVTVTESVTTEY